MRGVRQVNTLLLAQATNALLFTRMVVAHLTERLGSEELQEFATAPPGFMLEAANGELAGPQLELYRPAARLLQRVTETARADMRSITSRIQTWLQGTSPCCSSSWQRS